MECRSNIKGPPYTRTISCTITGHSSEISGAHQAFLTYPTVRCALPCRILSGLLILCADLLSCCIYTIRT